MQLTPRFTDYELIDSGDREKLERFGRWILRRPEPQAIWHKSLSEREWNESADASFRRDERNDERGEWRLAPHMPSRWNVRYDYRDMHLSMRLGLTSFKHVGIFPEQAANWNFIHDCCTEHGKGCKVLNLFAYTGGATLAAAAAGAQVTHVDASKGMVQWAKENAEASHLKDAPIRWLVDDCMKFVEREIRRGNTYDAIIMDPPSYGRGPKGEIWKIEDSVYPLVQQAAKLLTEDSIFFLINSYTTGLQPAVMSYMLGTAIRARLGGVIHSEEVGLPVTETGLVLPCGCSGRWESCEKS